ncbi:Conjugal transfer protein, fragment [Erwinia pyrifoliae Ep1/96]|nr:Conjugal transfer protein, fragment [Erwinia pyrifoliae Ep1/96]
MVLKNGGTTASIILLVLTNKLPLLLSGVVGGASLQGIGGFGAGVITGAAATAISGAATAISGAGTMAMSTTAQVSGGVSALKAAFESAQTAMAEESGSTGGASGGGFGGCEDTGSVNSSGEQPSVKGSSSGGSEGFAASFSRAGRMARHMGSSMVNGAAEYQTMKQSSNSSRAQQTIGGELATQIRRQTATRRDNREHDDFAGDSSSGNNKS